MSHNGSSGVDRRGLKPLQEPKGIPILSIMGQSWVPWPFGTHDSQGVRRYAPGSKCVYVYGETK